jgi:hypothetical protein
MASLRAGSLIPITLDAAFPMSHYYFHIKAGADLIKDDEGSEHATLDHARWQALKTARELWADAIKSGKSLEADVLRPGFETLGWGYSGSQF